MGLKARPPYNLLPPKLLDIFFNFFLSEKSRLRDLLAKLRRIKIFTTILTVEKKINLLGFDVRNFIEKKYSKIGLNLLYRQGVRQLGVIKNWLVKIMLISRSQLTFLTH